jgi:hypothetical protein
MMFRSCSIAPFVWGCVLGKIIHPMPSKLLEGVGLASMSRARVVHLSF